MGAAALGDIGQLYPDSDAAYLGIDSMLLLQDTVRRVREKGYAIGNLDVTIIAQKPKLAPYKEAMRKRLAEVLGISEDAVSVKATTEEGLGFTGSGDGIAVHAVCLLLP